MKRLLSVFALTLLAALLQPTSARAAEEVEVEILEPGAQSTWSFSPSVVTVSAGSTVTWRNLGQHVHSVTSQDQLFDSRLIDPGKSWSHTFTTPGTYRYFCVPNPWLKGVVVVTAAEDDDDSRDERDDSDDERDDSDDERDDSDDERTEERVVRPTPTPEEPAPRRTGDSSNQAEPTPTPSSAPTATPTATPSPARGAASTP